MSDGRKTFYKSGEALSVQGRGQPEGRQKITTLRRKGVEPCPKSGCTRDERGYELVVNPADAPDANLIRFLREGKAGRFLETALDAGLIKFFIYPGQCPGHKPDWQEPVYIVGTRKTNHDEYHTRYLEGGEALVKATTRALDMRPKTAGKVD